jgi:Domain of unknown function (DUF4114)
VKSIKSGLAGLALAVAATSAGATVIQAGGETSLQSVINSLYETAGCPTCAAVSNAPNVNTDQYQHDQLWSIEASGVSAATVIIEIAGNANTNAFGIYDGATGNTVQLFGGPADSADQALVSISDSGQVAVLYLQRDANTGFLTAANFWSSGAGYFSQNQFGYYLGTGGGTFYSDPSRNPGGQDQMVAFQGDGDLIKLPGNAAGSWGSSSYILAWEDLSYGGSDKDFNDFVVYVESVNGVAEPGSLALAAGGLFALGITARRRRTK